MRKKARLGLLGPRRASCTCTPDAERSLSTWRVGASAGIARLAIILTWALARVHRQESLQRDATDIAFVEGGSVQGYGRCSKYACDEETASAVPETIAHDPCAVKGTDALAWILATKMALTINSD